MFSVFNSVGVLAIVAAIMAIAAVVLAFIFIVPEKKKARMNKFGQFVHDTLNFKFLVIEKILQALYIFLTAFFIIIGFFMLFVVVQNPFGGGIWMGGYGLLVMILYPILTRLVFELCMMFVLLVKNTISINNKLKNQNEDTKTVDAFTIPDFNSYKVPERAPKPAPQPAPQPQAQPAPAGSFCTNCGAPLGDGNFCPSCGAKVR